MGKLKYAVVAALSAAFISIASAIGINAEAGWINKGYIGDLNTDGAVSVADIIKLEKIIVGIEKLEIADGKIRADLNNDKKINVFDSMILKHSVVYNIWQEIWEEIFEPTEPTEPAITTTEPTVTTVTTETTIVTASQAVESGQESFIDAPIKAVNASLPSQGTANLVVFYVDFPDCRYNKNITAEQIQQISFGEADEENANYPFESFSAFYERSSKGAMQLDGQVFRYTTKEMKSAYDTDKIKLAEECYEAFNETTDFSRFDGDGDGMIDATLFTVPPAAGNINWWPCAGGFGDGEYRVDNMAIGHIITGNAEIGNENSYVNYVSSYLHEMGHCMGLPDYYLYNSEDYDGLHGNAGTELMDVDASSDFGSFSKLMLGWYGESQVSVYNGGTQEYKLSNAQTRDGNCVIIPCGDLDGRCFSEYIIIEYVTEEANNSRINKHMGWWQSVGNGIRMYHVKADFHEDYWYSYLKYQNGSIFTNGDDDGIRLLRLVNDAEGGKVFKKGDVIDNSISGFNWYDENELEAIDPGVTVSVGELTDDKYTITISEKN